MTVCMSQAYSHLDGHNLRCIFCESHGEISAWKYDIGKTVVDVFIRQAITKSHFNEGLSG